MVISYRSLTLQRIHCCSHRPLSLWPRSADSVPAFRIIEALHLPRLVVPVLTVTLGWPDENPEQTDRLPVEAILHNGHYHEYTSEDIDRIYAAKEALPESRYFVELNGTDNLAQVFTRFRFTEAECLEMSAGMQEVLERQGFSRR